MSTAVERRSSPDVIATEENLELRSTRPMVAARIVLRGHHSCDLNSSFRCDANEPAKNAD